jgi:hypothetical protein
VTPTRTDIPDACGGGCHFGLVDRDLRVRAIKRAFLRKTDCHNSSHCWNAARSEPTIRIEGRESPSMTSRFLRGERRWGSVRLFAHAVIRVEQQLRRRASSPQSAWNLISRHFSMHLGLRQPQIPSRTIPFRSPTIHRSSRVDFRTPRMKPLFCSTDPVAVVFAALRAQPTFSLKLWRS